MAIHIGGGEGGGGGGGGFGGAGAEDELEDDDDIICGVNEDYRKQIDALKRACVLDVGLGGYVSTPAGILSSETPACNEEDDDDDGREGEEEEGDDDDDAVLSSIRTKYGSILHTEDSGAGLRRGALGESKSGAVDTDSEDDEEILRSVEQLYTKGGKNWHEEQSPELTAPGKDSGTKDIHIHQRTPSPAAEEREAGDENGCFEPNRSPDAVEEPDEEAAASSIASFLPGSWIDTEGDEEFGVANPVAASKITSTQYLDKSRVSTTLGNGKACTSDSVQTVTNALQKNRQCQRTLKNTLSQLEAKMKVNAEMQRRVRTLVEFEKYCNRRFAGFFTDQANPSVKLISAKTPGLQHKSTEASEKTASDSQTCGPPENPDVEIYRKLQQKASFAFNSRRWSNAERIELAKGVKQQVYEAFVRQAMDDISVDVLDEGVDGLDDRMSKIGQTELTAHDTRTALPWIDWAEVARLYVVGHSPEECRSRWMNHEDPLVNKDPWRKIEDKRLLSIAQTQEFCNWEIIAQELGTNRTPAECLTRYQRSLNASILRRSWTREEDNQLRAAVEELGENDWSTVAACLEGRNNSQCLMRWYKVLHPTKKKSGRWSVEEDKRLKWAVSVYGPRKWKRIAEHVPGRTDLQCRERWCNVLDPSIKLGEWTAEEDEILEASVARHGPHRWAAVANDLKIRTDNQCCRRWKALHPEDQPAIQRTVHIRRIALAGNFQGRKKERPRLGPQDFISRSMDNEASRGTITGSENLEGGDVAELASKAIMLPIECKSPRTRRAERIQIRRVARAKQLYKSGTAQRGRLDREPMDGTEGSGMEKGPKRKSGSRNNSNRPRKQANIQASKSGIRRDSQELPSNGPHISSFLDLVCSLRDYCKYVDLVARDEGWPGFLIPTTFSAKETSTTGEATHVVGMSAIPACERVEEREVCHSPLSKTPSSRNSPHEQSLKCDMIGNGMEPENNGDIHMGARIRVDDGNHGSSWLQGEVRGLQQYAYRAPLQPTNGVQIEIEKGGPGTWEATVLNESKSIGEDSGCQETLGWTLCGNNTRDQPSHHKASDQMNLIPVSSPLRQPVEVIGGEPPQPMDSMHGEEDGGDRLSREDEEVAAAAKAVLSWPFFSGVQKFWSQGTTYLRSKVPNHTGRRNIKNTENGRSIGLGPLSSVGKKPRSKHTAKLNGAKPLKMRGAIPQASSSPGAQMLRKD